MNLEKYDKINIEDLEIFANHGVFPEENKLGQKFMVSATLYTCLLYTSPSPRDRG